MRLINSAFVVFSCCACKARRASLLTIIPSAVRSNNSSILPSPSSFLYALSIVATSPVSAPVSASIRADKPPLLKPLTRAAFTLSRVSIEADADFMKSSNEDFAKSTSSVKASAPYTTFIKKSENSCKSSGLPKLISEFHSFANCAISLYMALLGSPSMVCISTPSSLSFLISPTVLRIMSVYFARPLVAYVVSSSTMSCQSIIFSDAVSI